MKKIDKIKISSLTHIDLKYIYIYIYAILTPVHEYTTVLLSTF